MPGPMTLRGRILLPDGALVPGTVKATGGLITEVAADPAAAAGSDYLIAPGFIDLQVNGAFGRDFAATPDAIPVVARRLPATGVTSFLPTFTSSPLPAYSAYLEAADVRQGGRWRGRPGPGCAPGGPVPQPSASRRPRS